MVAGGGMEAGDRVIHNGQFTTSCQAWQLTGVVKDREQGVQNTSIEFLPSLRGHIPERSDGDYS